MKKRKTCTYIFFVFLLLILVSACSHIDVELKEAMSSIENSYNNLIHIDISENLVAVSVDKYFETNEHDKVTEVLFTPDDCVSIMNEFVEHCDMSGINLSFEFPNGTRITFSNYNDGRYTTVEIDNSRAFGAIIPNVAYYSSYTGFDNYYIYGVFNDHSYFGDTVSVDEIDRSFLEYIAQNANVYMDEKTSESFYKFTCSYEDKWNEENRLQIEFAQYLISFNENMNLYITEDDESRQYLSNDDVMYYLGWVRIEVFDDIGLWDIDYDYELPDLERYERCCSMGIHII